MIILVLLIAPRWRSTSPRLPRHGQRLGDLDRHQRAEAEDRRHPAGILNLVGAFLSVEVAITVTTSVLKIQDGKTGSLLAGIDPSTGLTIIFSGLIGGILWNLLTWLFGIPSSSSHALFGGSSARTRGARPGGVNWGGVFGKVILPALARRSSQAWLPRAALDGLPPDAQRREEAPRGRLPLGPVSPPRRSSPSRTAPTTRRRPWASSPLH